MAPAPGKYHFPESEGEGELLPNKLGIDDPDELHEAEAEGFANAELDLIEELTHKTFFGVTYIRDIHRRALSHLYEFAGEYRSLNISKGGFMFAAAHAVPQVLKTFESEVLSNLPHRYEDRESLIRDIGEVHAELLFIHPFREGNGRTMRTLANMMAYKAGYPRIDFDPVGKKGELRERYYEGVQAAAEENYQPMIGLIKELFPAS